MQPSADQAAAMAEYRRRYKALQTAGTTHAQRALPPATALNDAPIAEDDVLSRRTIPGGWYTTARLERGEALRLVNTEGAAAVSLLAWNAADPSERLNHADTVKIQWSARLRKGRVLFSDMGRVLLSLIEDTSGAHDALVGGSTAASTAAKYGPGAMRNTRDNLVLAACKLGLARRDVAPSIAFFAPVAVEEDGRFAWGEGLRRAGDFVDLRAEMDLLVALSNCPHPLDPAETYAPGSVEVVQFRAPPVHADDICRTATPEAARGFENLDPVRA